MRMLEEVYGRWIEDAVNVRDWVIKKAHIGHYGPQFTVFLLKNL